MSEENEHSTEPETLPADIFNRESIAQAMSRILCEFDRQDVSPAVLNGPWGCGKSVHAQRMKQYIEDTYAEAHKCIYWNASAVDFAKEPLPMFVAALSKEVRAEERDEFARNGLSLCAGGLIGGMTSIASQLSSHWLGVDARQVVADAKQDALDSSAPDALVESFKQFLAESNLEEKRMEAASKLVTLAGEGKELIIIIDELDRCRPNFALSLLESIKHLFSRTRCRFLLVMNKVSMVSSIQHLYGLDENQASLYLNKFITQEFSIPNASPGSFEPEICILHYFKTLVNGEAFPRLCLDELTGDFVVTVFRNKHFQLREIEKLARAMQAIQRNATHKIDVSRNRYHTLQLTFAAYLVGFYPNLVFEVLNGTVTAREVLTQVGCYFEGRDVRILDSEIYGYLEFLLDVTVAQKEDKKILLIDRYKKQYTRNISSHEIFGFASLLHLSLPKH